MKINVNNLEVLHSAISFFIKEPIISLDKTEDLFIFQTLSGVWGSVEQNMYNGNSDIWVGEILMYELENELFEILSMSRGSEGLISFYNIIKDYDSSDLKELSKQFFDVVKKSTENIILNQNLPLHGHTIIEETEVQYYDDKKLIIHLN